MIVHDHIVASEDHKQYDTDHIDKECRNRGYHVGKTGTCHKDCVDACDRGKPVRGTDPEIGLPENQHGQKHGNSDNTVVISDEFTI